MFRYNSKYQAIADEFAKAHGEGEWIGAHYLGHHHEEVPCPGGEVRDWLVFEPVWAIDEKRFLGVVMYILIEKEEGISLFSSIYDLMRTPIEAELNGQFLYTQEFD